MLRKVYPGADVPTFEFKPAEDGSLVMGYHSLRRLCALAQGFIEGAAVHFHETAEVDHLECMHHGKAQCTMRITFSQAA
ncbi:MAG: heme NO-binding domain-containing protein [Bradyrhizobium sp.]